MVGKMLPCLSQPACFQSAARALCLTSCWWERPHCHSELNGAVLPDVSFTGNFGLWSTLVYFMYEIHLASEFFPDIFLGSKCLDFHLLSSGLRIGVIGSGFTFDTSQKYWDICFPAFCGWPKHIIAAHTQKSTGLKTRRLRLQVSTYQYELREDHPLRPHL